MSKEMRLDPDKTTSSTNGHAFKSGSTTSSLQKISQSASTNGFALTPSGSSYTNGSNPTLAKQKSRTYFGHDREEVTRLLIQALTDLGYHESADKLVQESGFELESPTVAAFRHSVLDGEWREAEYLLFGTSHQDEGGVSLINGHSNPLGGLVLAEGVDKNELLFKLRRQKYLELLEARDTGAALMVLRQELTPLHQDVAQLHILSGLMVCQSGEDLKVAASWDGTHGSSRQKLLTELSKSIAPSIMIPNNRLAVLLDQVKYNQISRCHWHNPTTLPSLFQDHLCDRSQFPLQTVKELAQNDEVYFVAFSHDGRRLATCGKDHSIIIYDTTTFQEKYVLLEHHASVSFLAWSPDDTKLLSCSVDKRVIGWDVVAGKHIFEIKEAEQPITAVAWAPDGESFVVGSFDKSRSLNTHSALDGHAIHAWPALYRVTALAISPDGKRLVTISSDQRIFVYNFVTREEEYSLRVKTKMTSIAISRDSKEMLVNMADDELQLINIHSAEIVRRFRGQKQGEDFVIRSTFGGSDENLVISGSEDSIVYIWHKENGTLIEMLPGHSTGCVNAVAWNPADPCMFASAGDDKKVRIWSKESGEGKAAGSRRSSSRPRQSRINYNGRLL